MNKGLKRVLQIGIPVVVVGAILIPRLDFSSDKSKSTSTSAPKTAVRGALPVTGVIASLSTSTNGIPLTGLLVANEEVELVSETAGKVVKIAFEEGTLVKKGTLLVKVDDSDLQAQLSRAEFQDKQLAAKLERQRVLLKRESISLEEFQQLETEYNMNLADIELLKVKIARTEIRAPFDGRMGFRSVSEGSYLQPSTKVSTIVDNSYLKVEFSIPEKYIDVPLIGRKISFQPSGLDYTIEAEVYAVDPQSDVSTHTINLRARYRNTKNLVAGMFVKGDLRTEEGLEYMLIPTEAVVPEMGGKRLWVVKNKKATSVPVETDSRDSKYVEVTSGIQVGDTVLTGGLMQLREGMVVSVTVNN
ncbi:MULTISPECIES: efflux RND transporter periplasmic adaptor subunit [Odoribacteraceae]|uniref:efflux RND transporter periplasmic adaptor subunit n=1 Tax=Odoribacteraceae TaxID=1853231 RepID=UPI000E520257|nr:MULTISPECIES: efflux RND transporter periplasmic adaptor subunit [Odoribacteraceae]MCQ4874681.1 efflux RND transporter periplasmic adaptor subunit [Butyricimonas paravirosa]RHR80425.1 efflux RND transporter periplasmic adaptor subunit [Odoribacter sp. AF15-53]